MQSQLVCCGCRNLLLYPRGAANVRCALCNMINTVSSPGMDTSQLICGGCRTLLVYPRGATSVRCSCCSTINVVPTVSQMAHVTCGHCHVPLMYPYGAPSVKCAMCNYITNTAVSNPMQNARAPISMQRPNGAISPYHPSTSTSHSQTVVIENPMSVDESGKLVSNVVVGVTTEKR